MNRKIKRIPQTTLSMKRAFDEFVVAQTAKGLTEPTIKNYHAHFHSISRHIDIEKSFSDLTQTDIDGMIVSMRKSGLATNSELSVSSPSTDNAAFFTNSPCVSYGE